MKKCSRCGVEKPLEDFGKDQYTKDGKRIYCKACVLVTSRIWRKENPQRVTEIKAKSYEKNSEKSRKYSRRWRKENPERVKDNKRLWRETNREKLRAHLRAKYRENPKKVIDSVRLWTQKNANVVKKRKREAFLRNPEKAMWQNAKSRAKKKGIPFSISVEDIKIPEICPILKIPLQHATVIHKQGSPTVDRIVTRLGYIPGNVWVISHRANQLKNDATQKELRMILEAVDAIIEERGLPES